MRAETQVRITAFIWEELAAKFTALTRRVGVSGTALLSKHLRSELDYLAGIDPQDQRVEAASRFLGNLEIDSDGNFFLDESKPKVRRLNITLDREVADRMSELCREKRIQRDQFINAYINFLVSEEGPLETVAKILGNPRHQFEEKRRNSPQEDQVLHNLNDDSIIINRPVPQENPYSHLSSMNADLLDRTERLMERFLKKRRDSK